MTTELVLYTNPMSRGRIARWMLEEVGQPYRTEILEFGPAMRSPAYLALNPMGKVPTLQHGDTVVTEVAAICLYLGDAFPQAGLAPPLQERGDYYRWMFFGAGPMEAALTNTALGVEVPPERRGMVGYGSVEAVLDTFEQALSRHDYLAGPAFTAADVYAGAQLGWGLMNGSIERRPAFEAYVARTTSRPAAQRARAMDDALLPQKPG